MARQKQFLGAWDNIGRGLHDASDPEGPRVGEFPVDERRFWWPEQLGKGSYGETWKAYDMDRGEYVAVKLFHSNGKLVTKEAAWLAEQAESECLFTQEVVQKSSSYPAGREHICNCLEPHVSDLEGKDAVPFIVMELCGESLPVKAKNMASAKKLQSKEHYRANVRTWIRDLLEAVAFLSGQDPPMSHSDIHGGNFVITEDGRAKLIDFGRLRMVNTAQGKPWESDVARLGELYGRMLCGDPHNHFWYSATTKACENGRYGLGTKEDFEVIAKAYKDAKNWSPQDLLKLMPGA